MSIDSTAYVLAALAIGMSMIAARNRQVLFTTGSAALWASLVAFILANTTQGENWQQIFLLASVAFVVAMFLLGGFSARNSAKSQWLGGETSEKWFKGNETPPRRGNHAETREEYRARIQAAYRRGRGK